MSNSDERPNAPALPAGLRARVLEAARKSPSPTRATVSARARGQVVAAIAVVVAVLTALGGPRFGERAPVYVLVTALGWTALSVAFTVLACRRGKSMLGRPRAALWLGALAPAPLLILWAFAWLVAFPREMTSPTPIEASVHLRCFGMSLVVGVTPLLILVAVRKRSDPVHPAVLGAAIGGASGAWAGTMMDLHCAVSGAVHVALGHACPALVLAGVGAVIGHRILGIRSYFP